MKTKQFSINLKIFTLLVMISVPIFFYMAICKADTSSSNAADSNIELFTGNTMGTTYHIKVLMKKDGKSKKSLSNLIEDKLKQVNQSMSVYLPDSEISLFNKSDKGDAIKISPEFYDVMITGQKLYTITEGSWDGTVKPLVDLWGFGTKREITSLPSSEIIKAHLQTTGFNQIIISNTVTENNTMKTLEKKNSSITLDLGSIAKGFGVDAVVELLKSRGYSDFLVEIGGELFAAGEKTAGKSWVVGISKPDKGGNPYKKIYNEESGDNDIYRALPIKNKALATSGDYMSFTTIEGKNYSHIINPATGYPVDNGVVSASVIADNCTFADGLATALMVMGHEKGIDLVNRLESVECLIVARDKDGKLKNYRSKEFPLP